MFLAAISWVGLGMGFDIRSGLIAQDFRVFLEAKLNSAFTGHKISLSRIEGGVLRQLTIDEFSVSKKTAGPQETTLPIFSSGRIIVKYNILNLLRRQFEETGGIYLISPSLFFGQVGENNLALPPAAPTPAPACC